METYEEIEENEVMQELKQTITEKIRDDILALLEKYKEPCVTLKMSVDINASINVVYYSGNGRRGNPPMTIAEPKVSCSTRGVTNWND